jgi:hypothetical protein
MRKLPVVGPLLDFWVIPGSVCENYLISKTYKLRDLVAELNKKLEAENEAENDTQVYVTVVKNLNKTENHQPPYKMWLLFKKNRDAAPVEPVADE